MSKFDDQPIYRPSDVLQVLDIESGTLREWRLKNYITCEFPSDRQGVPNMFSRADLLGGAMLKHLNEKLGIKLEKAAIIVRQIGPEVWQDVRDGLEDVVETDPESDPRVSNAPVFDPPSATKLQISLKTIYFFVEKQVEATFESRRKNNDLD